MSSFLLTKLLFEAPIDLWLKRFGQQEPSVNKEELQKYMDVFQKFSASISNPDPTSYDFESLKTTALTVEMCKMLSFKASTTKWLTAQIKKLKLPFKNIKEDYVPVLKQYEKLKANLKPIDAYKTIQEVVYDLEDLKQKSGGIAGGDEEDLGILYDDGEWIIAMPHTTEASCELGKGTTWFTARTDSQNLFLNYVGRGKGIILFYVIKKNGNPRSNPNDKMSVGFINGEAKFNQGNGNITVNASNQNLTQMSFAIIVGLDKANKFLQIMKEKATALEGKHPAEAEMSKYAGNVQAFQTKLKSFKQNDAATDFICLIMENKSLTGDVLNEVFNSYRYYFVGEDNEDRREGVYEFNWRIRELAADATDPNVIQSLINGLKTFDHEMYVLELVQNSALSLNNIKDIIWWINEEKPYMKPKQTDILDSIIYKHKLTKEIIHFLMLNFVTRDALAEAIITSEHFDPSTLSEYVLTVFAESNRRNVRACAANNPNTPKDVLFEMLNDEEEIAAFVRANPALSAEDLSVLLDQADEIKNDNLEGYAIEIEQLLANPNIGEGHIRHYYQEFENEQIIDFNFISTLIKNPKTPIDIRKDIGIKYGKYMSRQINFWKEQGLIPESKAKVSLTSLLF